MALDTKYKRPTPTIHHKKSVGAHQRHDKKFLKTYWPYLPVLMLAIVVIVFAANILGPIGAILGSVSFVLAAAALLLI